MRLIIKESNTVYYVDVENYLRGSELFNKLNDIFNFDNSNVNPNEVVSFIIDDVSNAFDIKLNKEPTIAGKVVNGTFYDFCAIRFNEMFNNEITTANLPVIQPVTYSDKNIKDNISSIKGYFILGY